MILAELISQVVSKVLEHCSYFGELSGNSNVRDFLMSRSSEKKIIFAILPHQLDQACERIGEALQISGLTQVLDLSRILSTQD
jgi:hypothetical protein